MSRIQRRALAVSVLLLAALCIGAWFARRARTPTFADVAPMVFRACAPCHRPGEAGPFPLLTYADVAGRRRQILRVVERGIMPPWKPVAGYGHFRDERRLTALERSTLRRWVDAGAPEGPRDRVPPSPVWPSGWRLGPPDVVLTLPQAVEVPAEGPDVYRNYVLPAPVPGLRYVGAWEFHPGGRAVHHAILNVDRRGWARRRDAEDAEPGFPGMGAEGTQSPDGFDLVWAPGRNPARAVPGEVWRVDARTDLVLQLHLHPSGRAESIRPSVGLYFAPGPATRPRMTFRLGDVPIDIAPGDHWTMTDTATLPVDVLAQGIFPHAHYLARRAHVWATLPGGRIEWLLRIDDWDLAWQDAYTFAEPVALPRGTVLSMRFDYDNSSANPRNPSSPPRRVRSGEGSLDEMGNVTLELAPQRREDQDALTEFKFRRAALADDPVAEFNLGNLLARTHRAPEALAHYRHAVAVDPSFDAAWFNLGVALQGLHDDEAAVRAFEAALRIVPTDARTHLDLGASLRSLGRPVEALRELRAAVACDATSGLAHAALAQALADGGDLAGSEAEFRAAVARAPDDPRMHRGLGTTLQLAHRDDESRAEIARAEALEAQRR